MTPPISKEWDSAFFGYPVASVELGNPSTLIADVRASLEHARQAGIRLLYLFLPRVEASVRSAIQRDGVRAVGRKVEYARPVSSTLSATPDPEIIPCHAYNAPLERLAFQSGEFSRFRLDEGFRNQEFERLYREWLGIALAGKGGKCVYAAGSADHPKGMVTLEPGPPVRIGLIAVDPACQRQGIGRKLMAQADRFCAEHHATELRVATQTDNLEACRFYEACGFEKISESDIFHAWLPDRPKK